MCEFAPVWAKVDSAISRDLYLAIDAQHAEINIASHNCANRGHYNVTQTSCFFFTGATRAVLVRLLLQTGLTAHWVRPFLPARRYASAGICYGICICLCVTRVLCIKTAKHFVKILLPPDSPIILVFRHRGSLLTLDGFTLNGEPNTWELENWRFLTNKFVYLGNDARYGHIVAIEVELETIPKLSNGGTLDDLE